MKYNNSFVITVGESGTVFVLHKQNQIKNKILITDLNSEAKEQIEKILASNKNIPIYILLDTIDQSYKKKDYPLVKKFDLIHLIKRDINSEVTDKTILRNHFILNDHALQKSKIKEKNWECIFASSSISKLSQELIEFLMEKSNRIIGIYMLPLEIFPIVNHHLKISNENNKDALYCVVFHNKISATRQVIFSQKKAIFTRLLEYDFENISFAEKYEKDLYGTFEYLKRLFPNIQIKDINVINIFSDEILKKISSVKSIDFNFTNYTPFKLAQDLFKSNEIISKESSHCDILLSKIFNDNKKKFLKFTTPKIAITERMFFFTKISYYANLVILLLIGLYCLFAISSVKTIQEEIDFAENEKLLTLQNLNRTTNIALNKAGYEDAQEDNQKIDIDRIIDFGRINDALHPSEKRFIESYIRLDLIKKHSAKISSFTFNFSDFNDKSPNPNAKYKVFIKGILMNKSGDIEDIFKKYDELISDTKKIFANEKVLYTELPRNIDFSKKYYEFPIDLTIESK